MTREELTARALRCAASLNRWVRGDLAEDIEPALAAELAVVAQAIAEHTRGRSPR